MQYAVSANAVLVKGGDVYPGNAAGTSATGAQVA